MMNKSESIFNKKQVKKNETKSNSSYSNKINKWN